MRPIARIYVSSTWLDLQPERQAVEKALQRLSHTKLNGMEYFGSRNETTQDVSLSEVNRSDVYISIIGGRFGSGITEQEYRRASEKNLPRFIYFKDEQTIPMDGRDPEEDKQARLATWKTELRNNHALGISPFTSPDDLAVRVTADLCNWLFSREIRQSLPSDYSGRIENFLIRYLGTPQSPVPFGGRETDLAALDTWLENAQSPPYLLMAAPAGRGRSALLTQWSRHLFARESIALVFVPISIRARTNLATVTFASLAARLARLHGEKVPDTRSTSVEEWRGLVTDYLYRPLPNGQTLVLILDGLDEAADWEAGADLFPSDPPNHIRVVVSARYRAGDTGADDWLRRLGWTRHGLARPYELDILTKEGVRQVLVSMGFPLAQLGAKIDIVSELYRLSEGDPLLVELYVKELWSHKEKVGQLQPEDLGKLKPRLKGYFDDWWDEQRKLWERESPLKEKQVQALLNVLACALGPLKRDDVLHLTKTLGITSWELKEILTPLNRFVIGDGKEQGYIFSHPRLGQYFYEELSESEQTEWRTRFLDWGREIIQALEQKTLAPTKAPAYIVQYYGAYLEQAEASAESRLTLVCHSWSQAWEALEGNYAGFLSDVDRAWKTAEQENRHAIERDDAPPHIGDEIRCALVRASVHSLASNLSPELLLQLVREQLWTFRQGLVYARQILSSTDRAAALRHLAVDLPLSNELRTEILLEALVAAQHLKNEWKQADILTTSWSLRNTCRTK